MANFAKAVACEVGFRYTVRKYKVREMGRVMIRVGNTARLWVGASCSHR